MKLEVLNSDDEILKLENWLLYRLLNSESLGICLTTFHSLNFSQWIINKLRYEITSSHPQTKNDINWSITPYHYITSSNFFSSHFPFIRQCHPPTCQFSFLFPFLPRVNRSEEPNRRLWKEFCCVMISPPKMFLSNCTIMIPVGLWVFSSNSESWYQKT